MSDCTRCHGAGYVYITNGDNDHTCPSCAGTGERQLTLPEALWIVSSNAQGAKHNYFDEYLPAILLVNETWPITDYNSVEGDTIYFENVDYIQFQHEQTDYQDFLKG